MKNILFFNHKQNVCDLVSQYLKVEYTFKCDSFTEINSAKQALRDGHYDLVFAPDSIFDENSDTVIVAKELLNIIIDLDYDTKLIYTGDLDIIHGNSFKYEKDLKLDQLGRDFISYLDISKDELSYIKLPDYVPVKVTSFYLLTNPCTDIYLRIKKKDGDQFVKRINANDDLDRDLIKKYEGMDVSELFVKKETYSALMAQIMNQSVNRLKMAYSGTGDLHEVSSDIFEISQNMLENIGVTPQTVSVVRTSIKSMIKMVSGDSKISALLRDLMSNEGSYSYKRSYLITLFVNQILPHLGWGRGEQLNQALEKLTFVAFFHDCFLREEHLLKIMSHEDLERANLDEKQVSLVNEHANKASTLIQSFPQCPAGVDIIIKQHHGSVNGVGFPKALTSSISPMAITFIVVESFVSEVLNMMSGKEKISLADIYIKLDKKFQLPSYRKVLECIKNVTGS